MPVKSSGHFQEDQHIYIISFEINNGATRGPLASLTFIQLQDGKQPFLRRLQYLILGVLK